MSVAEIYRAVENDRLNLLLEIIDRVDDSHLNKILDLTFDAMDHFEKVDLIYPFLLELESRELDGYINTFQMNDFLIHAIKIGNVKLAQHLIDNDYIDYNTLKSALTYAEKIAAGYNTLIYHIRKEGRF